MGLKCGGCGYSLTGLTGTMCPECGGEFNVEDTLAASLAYAFDLDRPRPDKIRQIRYELLASVLGLAMLVLAGYLIQGCFRGMLPFF